MKNLIFVDCEATGPCPGKGEFTEFGVVDFASRQTFHGVLFESRPNLANPAHSEITGQCFDPVRVFTDFDGKRRDLCPTVEGRAVALLNKPPRPDKRRDSPPPKSPKI